MTPMYQVEPNLGQYGQDAMSCVSTLKESYCWEKNKGKSFVLCLVLLFLSLDNDMFCAPRLKKIIKQL